MAPKKGQKMSLNEFLGDSTLGSWADEMDSLPSAPAIRSESEMSRSHDRHGRRGDDYLSSRSERNVPAREDLPLPTQPPYTAFVGNLPFDLLEKDIESFFDSPKIKSVKIIKDKDDRPKGFGYVEFEDLDGLKDALSKTGLSFSGRAIRVSVAEPPKERYSQSGGMDDDSKFDQPWRRDGPLPDLPDRDGHRRRQDGPAAQSGVADNASDWRSGRTRFANTEADAPNRRKGSGFSPQEGMADREEVWTIGSKFKPSAPSEDSANRFGNLRSRSEGVDTDTDWRGAARQRPGGPSNTSPGSSTPPTPQLTRRKLELLPRSGAASASPSPLSSPKMAPASAVTSSRASPFGAAKPVDVSSREKAITDRIEKDREANRERMGHPMSRSSSHTATDRNVPTHTRTPSSGAANPLPPTPSSPKAAQSATVRPSLSFANAAAATTTKDRSMEDGEKTINWPDKSAEVSV